MERIQEEGLVYFFPFNRLKESPLYHICDYHELEILYFDDDNINTTTISSNNNHNIQTNINHITNDIWTHLKSIGWRKDCISHQDVYFVPDGVYDNGLEV